MEQGEEYGSKISSKSRFSTKFWLETVGGKTRGKVLHNLIFQCEALLETLLIFYVFIMNDYSVFCLLFFLRLMECSCSSLIVLSLISMSTADWDLTSPLLSDLTSKVVVVVSLLLKEDLDFIIDY